MQAYWVTFTDGTEVCCEGQSAYDAKCIAEHFTKKTVAGGKYKDFSVKTLPYPASPVVWQFEHPTGGGKCPTFCYTPRKCAGLTSCPANRSCDD